MSHPISRKSLVARKSIMEIHYGDEMKHHSGSDLREAEHWGEIFRDKDAQRDPATAEHFYAELKVRLIRRFGTITQAFKEIDVAGDGTINFLEWNSMLLLMHLPLESRACRFIFGCASAGDSEIDLEMLKIILLQPVLKKLKALMRSYKRVQDRVNRHMQTFLTELYESQAVQSVDRFQRRIKLPFCRQIYDQTVNIHSVAQQIQCKCIQDVTVDRMTVGDMIAGSVGCFRDGGLLLESQVPIMMKIIARVGNYKGNTMSLVEFMAALVYLSSDMDRMGKLQMMFDVFDTDQDTVLEDQQLKDLLCLICRTRSVFEHNPLLGRESRLSFQEELSNQEGLRNYECAKWRLHRRGNDEDAVNWKELWMSIQDQPDVMASLLPAPPSIHWCLDPLPVHMQDLLPRASTPIQAPVGHGVKKHAHLQHARTQPVLGHRPSSNQLHRPSSRSSRMKSHTTQGHAYKPQLNDFEKDLTDRFRNRLRRLGLQRETELKDGIQNPASIGVSAKAAPTDEETHGSVNAHSSSSSLQPSASQLRSRTCSLPRLGSSNKSLKGIGSGGQKSGLSRVSTAPMGVIANSSAGSSSMASTFSRIDKLPLVDSLTYESALKWGVEAADRHRLLVAAESIAEHENADMTHGHGGDLVHLDAFAYNCQLCCHSHALNPKTKNEDGSEH